MSSFPTGLPHPLAGGYGNERASAVARTQFEQGYARQRQRFSAVPMTIPVSWKLTSVQMVTFRTFFKTTIHHGTDWFSMELDIGDGFQTYTNVRFTEPYKADKESPSIWIVTGKIEVID